MKNIKQIDKEVNKLIKSGNIQKAIEYCQSLLTDKPTDVNLHIRLGDLYLDWHLDVYQAKQYIDEAVTEYQKAAEIQIDNGLIYYKIGVALYYKGELDKAINYFNIAIDKSANTSQCYYMIGNCLKKKCRFQDALSQYNLALKKCIFNSSRIHYAKYRLLDNAFYSNDKKMSFLAFWELILWFLTLPFDKEARKDLSIRLKRLKFIPSHIKALYYYFGKGDVEHALKCYNDVIDKMPGFHLLYVLLGDMYRKLGKLDEAIVEYKMSLWIEPLGHNALSGLVQTYEELGDYDNAISYYLKYIKIYPNNAVLHSNVANLYFMKGDTEAAVSHYQAAIILNPKPDWTSIVAQTLGYIQQNVIKNVDCAVANYQLANALAPKEIDVYISLGSAFYDNEDYDNALIIYRRALDLEPNNSKIHCNLGYLYWGLGELDEAIKEYELSIKFDPLYDIAHNNLGVIYLDDLVHIQKAIECFNNAIDCNPNYALAYYNLGRCYALKNENVEAAKYFQAALDVNSITNEIDPNDIQEKLNSLFN